MGFAGSLSQYDPFALGVTLREKLPRGLEHNADPRSIMRASTEGRTTTPSPEDI